MISDQYGNKVIVDLSYIKDYLLNVFINNPENILYLLAIIILTLFNWGSEVLKWKILIGKLVKIDTKIAIRSILGGVAASNITPFRVGGFFARVAHLPFRHRIRGIAILSIGDIAQLTTTILMGSASLFMLLYFREDDFTILDFKKSTMMACNVVAFFGTLVFCFIFMHLKSFALFLDKIPALQKVKKIWSVVAKLDHKKTVIQLLGISTFRLVVILLQYYLVFQLFGLSIDVTESMLITGALLMLYNFLPTLNILEMGLTRTGIFLVLLSMFLSPDLVTISLTLVLTCSLFVIWLVNLVLPAVFGSYYLLKIKLFNHK